VIAVDLARGARLACGLVAVALAIGGCAAGRSPSVWVENRSADAATFFVDDLGSDSSPFYIVPPHTSARVSNPGLSTRDVRVNVLGWGHEVRHVGPCSPGHYDDTIYDVPSDASVRLEIAVTGEPSVSLASEPPSLPALERAPLDGPLTEDQLCERVQELVAGLSSAASATTDTSAPLTAPPVGPSDAYSPLAGATDGPIPPGTIEAQQQAVLSALRLEQAADVRFDIGGGHVGWIPGGFSGWSVTLDNQSGMAVSVPVEATFLHWTGSAWERFKCTDPETSDPASGLCDTRDVNAQVVEPGAHRSDDDASVFFGPPVIGPGTYAVVLPVWRTTDDFPASAPSEAAIAIVTLTSKP